MSIKLFFLGCLIVFSTSLLGSDAGEFRGETKAKIEILQKQSDQTTTKIDSLEKDIRDEYKIVTDRQNERIGDIENHFNIFLAILGIFAAIAGYITFKKSKELALTEVKDWLEKNGDSIKTEMAKFEAELEVLKKQAKDATDEHNKKLIATSQEAENELQKLQQTIQDGKEKTHEIKKTDNDNALSTIAQLLREKPQSAYTFEDWNKLAFDSYKRNQKDDALFYWRNAVKMTNEVSIQKTQILFNIGITLSQLNRSKEAIAVYDELISELQETQNEALQKKKVNAIFNKAVELSNLNRSDEEIVTYDELINEVQGTQNIDLQIFKAKAMHNKAATFSHLNRIDDAITTYDKLIHELQGTQIEALQEQKIKAENNKGITLGKNNHFEDALLIFDTIINELETTSVEALQNQRVKALLNKGVLLGKNNHFKDAIKLFDEIIYKFKETQNETIQELKAAAFLNRFEMQIISGLESEEKIDENINQCFNDNKQNELQFNMLSTVKNALTSDQNFRFNELKKEFKDIGLGEWHWEELDKWADTIEDAEIKSRVIATIKQFKNWDLDSR